MGVALAGTNIEGKKFSKPPPRFPLYLFLRCASKKDAAATANANRLRIKELVFQMAL